MAQPPGCRLAKAPRIHRGAFVVMKFLRCELSVSRSRPGRRRENAL
ncbi:hypothetical protein [Desulfovibrio sp. MES5]|nr:hypothetical protein [Desulfovibrio sp. MES5]